MRFWRWAVRRNEMPWSAGWSLLRDVGCDLDPLFFLSFVRFALWFMGPLAVDVETVWDFEHAFVLRTVNGAFSSGFCGGSHGGGGTCRRCSARG